MKSFIAFTYFFIINQIFQVYSYTSIIKSNVAKNGGGFLYANPGYSENYLTVKNCSLSHHISDLYGGALLIQNIKNIKIE